ncbi:hypothetical protein [Pyruvatibacter mobilis]|uniref:hypothetical protein n=1 Tax=Pyruvatibacter mobilis TaxID=1712261 RepID=UPI003BA85C53
MTDMMTLTCKACGDQAQVPADLPFFNDDLCDYCLALGTENHAVTDVMIERVRQQQMEGWSPQSDDLYRDDELTMAAVCYLNRGTGLLDGDPPQIWPWTLSWWKPKSRRRDLVRAAALVIAEIERLDRAASKETAND